MREKDGFGPRQEKESETKKRENGERKKKMENPLFFSFSFSFSFFILSFCCALPPFSFLFFGSLRSHYQKKRGVKWKKRTR